MKNLLVLALVLIFSNSIACAVCPTPDEFRAKSMYFQTKALNLMSSSADINKAEALLDEQDRYLNSLYPDCMYYFRVTKAPDCSKLRVLTTAYYMMDKNKQPMAKAQIYNMLLSLPVSCQTDIDTTKIMIK